ncbi:MAG TPA: TadE family protein [Anaerolineae bacterium]|nr:TadE family protein [Anaerolineae bacterium]
MRRRAGGERGQSLAELALVMPLLLMILVAMVEVGWAMRSHLIVTTASREAARFAARRVFDYDEIDEVAEVALLSLNPVYDGADANATIIITKVQIDAQGDWTIDGGQPYVNGDLPVETGMEDATYDQIGADNELFNNTHPGIDSENNVVVVEVFYDHELLLGSRIAGDWVGLGPLRLYSRSISRIGVSRYE